MFYVYNCVHLYSRLSVCICKIGNNCVHLYNRISVYACTAGKVCTHNCKAGQV